MTSLGSIHTLGEMWRYDYKDYKNDDPLREEAIEPGKGIVGVEMHDVNGWNERHLAKPRGSGWLRNLLAPFIPNIAPPEEGP